MVNKDLRLDRILLAIGLLLYFSWGGLYKITLPDAIDPFWARLLACIFIGLILILSFTSDFVKRNLTYINYGLCFIITFHEAYVLSLNRISYIFVIDYLTLTIVFCAYFKKIIYLIQYLVYNSVLLISTYYFVKNPIVNESYLISTILSIDLFTFPIFSSRIRTQQKLAYNTDLLLSIFNESADTIFLLHPVTFYFLDCNNCALQIFNKEKSWFRERKLNDLLPGQFSENELAFLKEELKKNGVWQKEIYFKESGKDFYGDLAIKHIIAGSTPMLLCRIINITQRKEAEIKLQNKTMALERSNIELEQMAYVASHDLQEPLRTITSYVQLIKRRYVNQLDKTADEFIGYVVDGTDRMRMLINDLLLYAQLDTTTRPITKLDTSAVVNAVLKDLSASINEKQAEIIVAPDLPEIVANDVEINTLFQNLISNALKFSNNIEPKVYISSKELFEKNGLNKGSGWLFSVKDNGIGIDPIYRNKIFLIFQRLHTREKYSGTGIGLAMCKKIVESYGGKIWVESENNQGSTFYFTIYKKNSDF